jgi:hypothetical protein
MVNLIDQVKLLEAVHKLPSFEWRGNKFIEKKAIVELIEKFDCEAGLPAERLCERCANHKICIVYLKEEPDKLIRLSRCAFFSEGEWMK